MRGFLDPATCAALSAQIDERRRPSEIADDVGIANFTNEPNLRSRLARPGCRRRRPEDCGASRLAARFERADPGPALCTGAGIQAAHRHVRAGRLCISMSTPPRPGSAHGPRWSISTNRKMAGRRGSSGSARRSSRSGQAGRAGTICFPTGDPILRRCHQGMKVRRGTEYILTKWFRERSV